MVANIINLRIKRALGLSKEKKVPLTMSMTKFRINRIQNIVNRLGHNASTIQIRKELENYIIFLKKKLSEKEKDRNEGIKSRIEMDMDLNKPF